MDELESEREKRMSCEVQNRAISENLELLKQLTTENQAIQDDLYLDLDTKDTTIASLTDEVNALRMVIFEVLEIIQSMKYVTNKLLISLSQPEQPKTGVEITSYKGDHYPAF
jgi:hypothetical protein